MSRVLVISSDVVDHHMGGVGVRNWEIAHALARDFDVILAVPNETSLQSSELTIVQFDWEEGDLTPYLNDASALFIQGFTLHFHPYLKDSGIPLVVDLYVPYLLESLVWHVNDQIDEWAPAYEEYLRVQIESIRSGDFFICASDRQRDYWLGWLNALKRLNPHTFQDDPTFRKLIGTVPFGVPDDTPSKGKPVLKGIHPGIQSQDKLILWSGGIWDWLDPITLIRTMSIMCDKYPELKLYFLGTRHPNPIITGMTGYEEALQLSSDLKLLNKSVFFGDWVPYTERSRYLLEADLAVVTHPGHIETHFSFRTRILDCFWTGLPLVVTAGDIMSDLVREHDLGLVVPPGDVGELAAAIETMIYGKELPVFQQNLLKLAKDYSWNQVVSPLVSYLKNASDSPDKDKYVTETERVRRDKDLFLETVARDKDAFLERVVREKDEHFEKVLKEKDERVEIEFGELNASHQQVVDELSSQVKLADQRKTELSNLLKDRDAELSTVKEEIESKEISLQAAQDEVQLQSEKLHYYERLLPIRLWIGFRKLIGKE
jgi:glycosyltransferase involved in cell wall biosynthesis